MKTQFTNKKGLVDFQQCINVRGQLCGCINRGSRDQDFCQSAEMILCLIKEKGKLESQLLVCLSYNPYVKSTGYNYNNNKNE